MLGLQAYTTTSRKIEYFLIQAYMLSPQLSILHIRRYLRLHGSVMSIVQTFFKGLGELRVCLYPLIRQLQSNNLNLGQCDCRIHDAITACPSSLFIYLLQYWDWNSGLNAFQARSPSRSYIPASHHIHSLASMGAQFVKT